MRFDVVTLFPELFVPFLTVGVTRRADDQFLNPFPGIAEHPGCSRIVVLGRVEAGRSTLDVVNRALPRLKPGHGASHIARAERHRIHQPFERGELLALDAGEDRARARELARAQGFPDSYILAAPFSGGTLTETDQRHKIGNSVCPHVAAAVVRANAIEAMSRPDVRRKRAVLAPPPARPIETTSLFEEVAA